MRRPSVNAGASRRDGVDGAVDQRQRLAVALEHAAHDLGVDLLRRLGEADARRACSATTRASSSPSSPPVRPRASGRRARCASCSRTSSQTCSESTSDAVEVEDDRLDHPLRYSAAEADERRRVDARLGPLAPRRRRACGRRRRARPRARTRASRARRRGAARAGSRRRRLRATSRSAGRRARSAARRDSWPAPSSETAKPPAARSSSCSAACFAIEIPTSGGSSASGTSEATVRPSRSPSRSTVTTLTPAGWRRITSRSSSPPATRTILRVVRRARQSGSPAKNSFCTACCWRSNSWS